MSMLRENGMRALLMRWSSEGKLERLLLVFFFFFFLWGGRLVLGSWMGRTHGIMKPFTILTVMQLSSGLKLVGAYTWERSSSLE